MTDFNTATTASTKDEWLTPPALLAALGSFDLDPCVPPPECRPCPMAAQHISLPVARTETKGFHREIWGKAHAVFFFDGRLKFFHSDGTPGEMPNAPSCLVAYDAANTEAIASARRKGLINGRLVML